MPTGPELIAESYKQLIETRLAPLIIALPANERPKGSPPIGRISVRSQDRAHEERSDDYPFVVVIVEQLTNFGWADEIEDSGELREVYQCTYQVRVRVVCRSRSWEQTDRERKRLSHAVTQILGRFNPATQIITDRTTLRCRYRDSAEQTAHGPIGRTLAGADIAFSCIATETFKLDVIALAGTVAVKVVHVSELLP